jgi:oxygen-independent coproporphyrinogen-3 oxidase
MKYGIPYSHDDYSRNSQVNPGPAPGLYVHIPFCQSKCPYCNFYSIASRSLIPRWLHALEKEVSYYQGLFKYFDSLYVGGGTPTWLANGDLERLLGHLLACFNFAPDTEMTIEANPGDLNQEKINALRAMGVNRISLGVQSFDDHALSFLNRNHTGTVAKAAITGLQAAGFENIGLDLIYGFADQSLEQWRDTLYQAIAFEPEHLSCYQLTFENRTLFKRLKDEGKIRPLSEKAEYSFFTATSQMLEDHGYIHYEISNFAREDIYYSRHNRKYWHHIPYLGLGPSAHSFDGSNRWWNGRSVRRYCQLLEDGRAPIEGREELTEDQLRLESIALGLRTRAGFDRKQISQCRRSSEMLSMLEASGFLRADNDRIFPTRKGFLVADQIPSYFLT